MAFRVNTTTVIDDSRNLLNIANQATFVGSGNAQLFSGSVGTYAFLANVSGTANSNGETESGSNLRYAGIRDTQLGNRGNLYSATSPAGTWRCMGFLSTFTDTGNGADAITVWLRIS